MDTLGLSYYDCPTFSGAAFNSHEKVLETLPKLRNLYLNFGGTVNPPEKHLVKSFFRSLGDLNMLEYLKICCEKTKMLDEEICIEISKALRKLSNLEYLNINYSGCIDFEEECGTALAQGIGRLVKLKNLVLNLSRCLNMGETTIV